MSTSVDSMDTSVRVALRIRPQSKRETINMCRKCTHVTPGEPQILLGDDKAFTFDYVFNMNSLQSEVYNTCVKRLVDGALKGINATVLAYGQTGSGKTYTMGTALDQEINGANEGMIARAVRQIFLGIEAQKKKVRCGGPDGDVDSQVDPGVKQNPDEFTVSVQFMELYNEDIIDLLDPLNKSKVYKIHEDASGGICVAGATSKPIGGPSEALRYLQQGALARTTASTQMNSQSSRSHALFTILIRRQRVMTANGSDVLETLNSKFHFVDLAGSERLKRTGATGDRARESISINYGLLSLGNVISALGDPSKKAIHVPYRDTKLTRLLQDSLGGNSQTLMIACISPSDCDFMETLNTLKYANRARNIKNRIQVNRDQSSRTISFLNRKLASLQKELLEYKQGIRTIDSHGNATITDTFHENSMLMADNKSLLQRIKAMQETIDSLTEKNADLLTEKSMSNWHSDADVSLTEVVRGYITQIEKLQARLVESDKLNFNLKKSMEKKVQSFEIAIDKVPNDNFKKGFDDDIQDLPSQKTNFPKMDEFHAKDIQTSVSEQFVPEISDDSVLASIDCDKMQAELVNLSSDIELKSQMIDHLETSEKRMQAMRWHYEDKLNDLNEKITDMQMDDMSSSPTIDAMKPGHDVHERKLVEMQREMRKLQTTQKEHLRQQRELQSHQNQLRELRNELLEMKTAKIKLMRRILEENNRHKESESRKMREIAQLRKEAIRNQNTIKSLQAQTLLKSQVLRRRTEQVTALKKSQHPKHSAMTMGQGFNKKSNNSKFHKERIDSVGSSGFKTSPRAKQKWDSLQNEQYELEQELERLQNKRVSLSKNLVNVKRRQNAGSGNMGPRICDSDMFMQSKSDTYFQKNKGKASTAFPSLYTCQVSDIAVFDSTISQATFDLDSSQMNRVTLQDADSMLSGRAVSPTDSILPDKPRVEEHKPIRKPVVLHVNERKQRMNTLYESVVVQDSM